MPTVVPPARTEISDTYPLPSDGTARIGFGKLWDYVTNLLGVAGSPESARAAIETGVVDQNIQSGNYTLVLTDVGKQVYSLNTGAQTITLPTNASIAFKKGSAVTLINNGTTQIVLATTGTVVYKAGTSAAWASGGTLAIRGLCTLIKADTDTWWISGAGLS